MKMFTFYDSKAEVWSRPWFAANRGSAIRLVTDMMVSGEDMVAKHPGDFFLFEIADFDDVDGSLVLSDPRVALGCCIEFQRKEGQ